MLMLFFVLRTVLAQYLKFLHYCKLLVRIFLCVYSFQGRFSQWNCYFYSSTKFKFISYIQQKILNKKMNYSLSTAYT